jgi:hypothetical protein
MKEVTISTYRKDKYYPRVVQAVARILIRSDVVAPVEVLLEMGNLSKKNHDAWLAGHVPYLERVFEGSLSKANRILRIIGFHAHDLSMIPMQVKYRQAGSRTGRELTFSKRLEEAYSRHYKWNQSQEKKRKAIEDAMSEPCAPADSVKTPRR